MLDKPFVLSVRGVIYDDQERILITQRSLQSTYHPGYWEFPGGKVDPGETFADALPREVKEETGLTVKLVKVLGTAQWEMEERVVVYLIMQCAIVKGKFTLSDENEAFEWKKPEELTKIKMCPQFMEFVKSLVSMKK